MHWAIEKEDRTDSDPTGVDGFVKRMEGELRGDGPPMEGFHFLNSPMDMLTFTREIEDEIRSREQGADLYVGFQTAEKMIIEGKRYQKIVEAGAKVVAFGQGVPPETVIPSDMQWVTLDRSTTALANQWYLVSTSPTPIGFVAWETSAEDRFAKGGLSEPGKMFKGFATNDTRVVNAIVSHLEDLNQQNRSLESARIALKTQLKTPIKKIMTLTERSESVLMKLLRSQAAELASANAAELILFELSAASYLASPYPEEDRSKWIRILNERDLMLFGRSLIAKQLNQLENSGITAGAILPTTHGFRHLAEWAEKENIDVIIIPFSLVDPGLLERLRRYSLRQLLENTSRQVVVVDEDGTMWHANPESLTAGNQVA